MKKSLVGAGACLENLRFGPQALSLQLSWHPRCKMGSVVLPHLVTGWHVDQAIMSEEERLVVIRFGRDWDPDCMRQDEVLYRQNPLSLSVVGH